MELAVRDFIQQQHDAGPDAGSSATQKTPAPPRRYGWQTTCNRNVESARIWQPQLTLFPRKPREDCECMGLNWLAARQLAALVFFITR